MYGTHKKPEVLYSLEQVETRAQEQLANIGAFPKKPIECVSVFPLWQSHQATLKTQQLASNLEQSWHVICASVLNFPEVS